MSKVVSEIDLFSSVPKDPNRTVHDLRESLVIAVGYLNELKIIRQDLLRRLSPPVGAAHLGADAGHVVTEIDTEMGFCIDMMSDSLEELDVMIVGLRQQLELVEKLK